MSSSPPPPRAVFVTDGVCSVRSLDLHRVWLPLKRSPYVQAWDDCQGGGPLHLGAVCGGNVVEADRFARGLYVSADRSIRSAPARDLKAAQARGAGAQLLRESARAAAVWHFVASEEPASRTRWRMLAALGEELCALPRTAFLNVLDHRLCTCGAARRKLRAGGLRHLLPEEVAALRVHSKKASAARALEEAGVHRERVLLVVAELSLQDLRLAEHLEWQVLDALKETLADRATTPCEKCRKRHATQVVMVRRKDQKPLTLRAGREARFRRKIETQRRKHPRSRWRLQRVCALCPHSVQPPKKSLRPPRRSETQPWTADVVTYA